MPHRDIIQRIQELKPGSKIPKPKTDHDFTIKGWGKRAKQG